MASTLLVSGCADFHPFGMGAPSGAVAPGGTPANQATPLPQAENASRKIAVLLPLSGTNGSLGQGMLNAARLALAAPGSPSLDVVDTAAPGGMTAAASAVMANGDGIVLGPLTSSDTAAIAPAAQAAGIPVLAFTSDLAQARPGVWVMGVTPEQQVRRLVFAAKAEGRTRMAALLPENPLGNAMADGLTRACADAGLPPPILLTHGDTPDSIASAARQIADLSGRQATQAAAQAGATTANPPAGGTPAGSTPDATPATGGAAAGPSAVDPAPALPGAVAPSSGTAVPNGGTASPVPAAKLPPPPFDALLLADTGLQLQSVIGALAAAHVSTPEVRIMGPGLWGAFAGKLGSLAGAWYAAPDPSARLGFVEQYQATYHQSPKLVADYPYDAAALARNLAPTGYGTDALLRPDGFAGVDGVFALLPDGHVHRALAVFQIQNGGGGRIVLPAPRTITAGQS
ncbi:MAG: penicillin-binding protein activator [Gluconacetobacter diazotrophicus]|nr:penicillin-binding protein activator [Gluconacetobacter diazotrophicus]